MSSEHTNDDHLGQPRFTTDTPTRIGLIVPSSNTTMETEIPRILERLEDPHTFHSSRARLHTVDAESLAAMVCDGDRCAAELADADVEVIAYACLVAVMAEGPGAHERIEARLGDIVRQNGSDAVVVSSAGALVRTLTGLGLTRVALVAPYAPTLTRVVIEYLQGYDIEIVDWVTLGVTNNAEVGRLDTGSLLDHVKGLDLTEAQAVVLSACVQMPSLAAVQEVEDHTGLPVITAATATTREVVQRLGGQLAPGRLGGRALELDEVARQ